MNSNETKIAAPITAGGLVKIAHDLIDSQHGGNNISKNQEWMRAGFKTGVTTMCMSVIEALPEWQADYQRPTLAHRNHGLMLSDVSWPTMRVGERKAGTVLDIETGVVYDLMLMPGELEDVTREQALAILNAAGGDLPSQCEMLMLEKLLGTATFETDAYWTKEKVKFEGDEHESHSCYVAGYFDFTEPYDEMRARGVRRVSVGDASDLDLRADTSSTPVGPDLSDRPDLQHMRADLLMPVPPLTLQGIVSVLEELDGIKDADDDAQLAAGVCTRVVDVINGLMLIADPDKLAGAGAGG